MIDFPPLAQGALGAHSLLTETPQGHALAPAPCAPAPCALAPAPCPLRPGPLPPAHLPPAGHARAQPSSWGEKAAHGRRSGELRRLGLEEAGEQTRAA